MQHMNDSLPNSLPHMCSRIAPEFISLSHGGHTPRKGEKIIMASWHNPIMALNAKESYTRNLTTFNNNINRHQCVIV